MALHAPGFTCLFTENIDVEKKGRPYLLRIGVRSETGYGPKTDQTSGKARSWWTNEFPETVSVLPTSAP